jgi:hypothetical protein
VGQKVVVTWDFGVERRLDVATIVAVGMEKSTSTVALRVTTGGGSMQFAFGCDADVYVPDGEISLMLRDSDRRVLGPSIDTEERRRVLGILAGRSRGSKRQGSRRTS